MDFVRCPTSVRASLTAAVGEAPRRLLPEEASRTKQPSAASGTLPTAIQPSPGRRAANKGVSHADDGPSKHGRRRRTSPATARPWATSAAGSRPSPQSSTMSRARRHRTYACSSPPPTRSTRASPRSPPRRTTRAWSGTPSPSTTPSSTARRRTFSRTMSLPCRS
jgi:hypothetical protein